jgi:hypothetical protein
MSVDQGSGVWVLENPLTNKGTAFSEEERSEQGLRGLLPTVVETLEQQVRRRYQAYQEHRAGAALCRRPRPRILSSRGESVEEHPWVGWDRRKLAARCCTVDGAGRVRCVAARGVPARLAVPRHGLPAGRLPGAAPCAGVARARRRAREQRRSGAGGRCMGARPAGLARGRARRVRAHPAYRGGVPADSRDRLDGPVAAARRVLVGMPAVRGVLPEHRPACGAGSAGADGAVRAAAGHRRYRGAAANWLGPRAPGPGGDPRRGRRGGDGPPVSPARLPRAVHYRGHAPGAGHLHQGAGRGGLRRAPSCSCWSASSW